MEAWIKVYHDLSDHPKAYALAEKLHIEQYAAVGLVTCLWIWALIHAPDGDLRKFPDTAIARACHWNKPAAGLVKALAECGFLDDRQIHDWDEYAGAIIEAESTRREKTRKRVEAYRARKAVTEALPDEPCNADVTRYTIVTGHDSNALRNADVLECNALRREEKRIYIEDDDERAREGDYRHSEIGTLISACLKAMTPRAWEELRSYMADLPEDLIAWAVNTACEHGGNNWAYVSKVLSGLTDAGIRTVEEAEKRSEEYRQRRAAQRPGASAPRTVAQNGYQQREYEERQPGDVPEWLAEMMAVEAAQ